MNKTNLTKIERSLIITTIAVFATIFVLGLNMVGAAEEGNECLGWYNNNRADFLAREGVLPGTFLTCPDKDELDKLNQQLLSIPLVGFDDNNDDSDDERLDIKYCANSGVWNGEKCIIEDEEEKAAYEDAVCDEPSDTKKYASICSPGQKEEKEEDRSRDKDDKKDEQQDNKEATTIKQIVGRSFDDVVSRDDNDDDDDDDDDDNDSRDRDDHDDSDDDDDGGDSDDDDDSGNDDESD